MNMTEEPRSCGDCGAEPGQHHQHGCDVERCARCGGQSIGCDCIYIVNGIDPATMEFTHPEVYIEGPTEEMYARWDREWGSRRLRWTGFWPGSLEAAAMGLFCVWVPEQSPPGPVWGWVPCAEDTPGAGPDLNRLHTHARWDLETQTWIVRKQRNTA